MASKWPWWLRVLWHTDRELDLFDDQGKIDHGKAVGLFVFLIFVTLLVLKIVPASVGLVIVLISAAFGNVMFRTFLRSRTVTSAEQIVDFKGERPEYRDLDNPDDVE